jgi:hypothetical protein
VDILVTVGIADTGFIFFVLVPGDMPVWPGILSPVFWALTTIFSTIALLTRTKGVTRIFTSANTRKLRLGTITAFPRLSGYGRDSKQEAFYAE